MLLSNRIPRKLARLGYSSIENLVLFFCGQLLLHCILQLPHCIFQGYHRFANDEEKKIFLRVREKSGNVILSQGKLGFFLKRFQLLFRLD